MSTKSTPNVAPNPWRKASCNAVSDTGLAATSFTAPMVRVGGLHALGAVLGWHPQTLEQPLPVHPQGYRAMLQQGTLGTLLGTADHFFCRPHSAHSATGQQSRPAKLGHASARPVPGGAPDAPGDPGPAALPPTPCRYDDSAP